jgi:hypothetical protein
VALALKESADPAVNPNSASATVTACPMTESFWVGVDNGPWATRPTYDCAAGAVPGTRDDKGVWTFDLTLLASQWLAEDREFAPAVVLVSTPTAEPAATEAPDPAADPAASTFQVAFDKTAGVGLVASTLEPTDDEPVDDDPAPAPEADPVDDGGSSSGSGGGLSGVGEAILDAMPEAPPADAAPPPGTETEAAPAQTTASTLAPVAAPVLAWHDEIGAKALLAVPALLLAYLVMLAMGPAGQPAVGGGRRGVSRALDRMRTSGMGRLPGRTVR